MYNTLLKLEKDFFKIDKMTDVIWLDSILHDDFKEIGSSGSIFYKQAIIDALSSLKADREIVIYNFECLKLNSKCWLVNYVTTNKGEMFYRTSIWLNEETLKIIFHQASKLNDQLILNES